MNDNIKLAKYIKCIHNTLTEIPICDIITKTGYICKVEAVHLVEIGNQKSQMMKNFWASQTPQKNGLKKQKKADIQ